MAMRTGQGKQEGNLNSMADQNSERRSGIALRMFPWVAALLAVGAVSSAISNRPPGNAEGIGGTGAQQIPPVSAKPEPPAGPYAHLQDQVVPRDLKTIHEGGTIGLVSIGAEQDTADFCDESHWSKISVVKEVGKGQVFVDAVAWENTPTGTRAQLASWMSRCTQEGQRVAILGEGSGQELATYHPAEGLLLVEVE